MANTDGGDKIQKTENALNQAQVGVSKILGECLRNTNVKKPVQTTAFWTLGTIQFTLVVTCFLFVVGLLSRTIGFKVSSNAPDALKAGYHTAPVIGRGIEATRTGVGAASEVMWQDPNAAPQQIQQLPTSISVPTTTGYYDPSNQYIQP